MDPAADAQENPDDPGVVDEDEGDELADFDGSPDDEPPEPVPYEFSPNDVAEAVKMIDAAYEGRVSDYEGTQRIIDAAKSTGRDPGDPLTRELASITSYQLRRNTPGKAGCELGSTPGDHPWPTPPREVPAPVVDLWLALAPQITAPAAKARLHDLLFVGQHGNGFINAQAAADAYMSVAADPPVDLEVIDALTRAWTLARTVKLPAIDIETRHQLYDIADALLKEDPHHRAGILMPALAILAEGPLDKKAADPLDVDALLATAAGTLINSDQCTRVARHRRSRATDPAEREAIDRDEIDGYFRDACERSLKVAICDQ